MIPSANRPETQDERAARLAQEAEARRQQELSFDLTSEYARKGYDWMDMDLTGAMKANGWHPLLADVYGYLPDTILPMIGGGIGGAAGFVGDGWEDLTGLTEGRSSGRGLAETGMAMAENPMAGTGVGRGTTVFATDDIPTLLQTQQGAAIAGKNTARAGKAFLRSEEGSIPPIGHNGGPPMPGELPLLRGTVADLPEKAQRDILKAIETVPELEDIIPMIHPEEAVGITKGTAQQTVDAFKAVDQDALEAAALAGQAKRGWYEGGAKAIKHVFGRDKNRFTALLSSLSPQTSVESNLLNALNVWKNWTKAGRPTDAAKIKAIMGQSVQGGRGEASVLDAWVNNSVRSLTAPEGELAPLSGPKVDSFGPNSAGDLSRVTQDVHQADLTGFDQGQFGQTSSRRDVNVPGYGPGYIGASAAHRATAKNMTERFGETIQPGNVQEMAWSFAKPMKDLYSGKGNTASMQQLYESGALTDDLVVGTPDFATLLQDPTYGNILREAGYGKQLDTLEPPTAVGRLDATPDPDALRRATSTLQNAVDRNGVISATSPFRVGTGDPSRLGYKPGGRGVLGAGSGDVAGVQLTPDPAFVKAAEAIGAEARPFIKANKNAAESTAAHAAELRAQIPEWIRGFVDPISAKDYAKGTALVTDGGSVFVKPTGEISGLMKSKDGPRKFAISALHAATQNGGTWLNAVDGILPRMYSEAGFRPVARIKFDPKQAPEGFDPVKFKKVTGTDTPDIVFMVYDPKFKGKVTTGYGGKRFDTWDDAEAEVRRHAEKLHGSN